ncbi:flagellar biosynthesis anti-sigma factor FlgM [Inmirania thermothiophila]|uniref:Negative regulator of flagellin synthesis n=1 Tax=Inmirania thermothiophila TaxID=1750597 RepID=A0A3N1Y7W1_9GAMM|nr:flagellar biosynthesis anti-sigma factor FlgM [Inmirania thermothiophila]ROR34904.1 FlgM family anti-sigma-28 factor [Inmirania thermothiophila]
MAIEINGSGGPQRLSTEAREGARVDVERSEPSARQQETGRPATYDTVSLTDTARTLQSLTERLAELPVVDTQRVEQLRQAIADGSYQVDPQRVAARLLAFESALGGKG